MEHHAIDGGRPFDWGRTSPDYAKYRDIYPPEFYAYLTGQGLCTAGQQVLDIGTGTGVLPRNLYAQGARFTGVDLAENQIQEARRLAQEAGQAIAFLCCPAEALPFAPASFDVVTACQCFTYFDHARLAPSLHALLKDGGRFAVLYMAWLPAEDAVAAQSERLVLRYNPAWTGGGETRRPIEIPAAYDPFFTVEARALFDLDVPFTRESWNGRIKACRGIGASLPPQDVARFEREHQALLEHIAPAQFTVKHYAAAAVLQKRAGA